MQLQAEREHVQQSCSKNEKKLYTSVKVGVQIADQDEREKP